MIGEGYVEGVLSDFFPLCVVKEKSRMVRRFGTESIRRGAVHFHKGSLLSETYLWVSLDRNLDLFLRANGIKAASKFVRRSFLISPLYISDSDPGSYP
jgi:hypothetical protein